MMRLVLCFVALIVFLNPSIFAQSSSLLSDRLSNRIQNNNKGQELIAISIFLSDRVDIIALDKQLYLDQASMQIRAFTVINSLKEKARISQIDLLQFLRSSSDVDFSSIQGYWVTNVVFCKVKPNVLNNLILRSDIGLIDLNITLELDEFEIGSTMIGEKSIGGHEPGHDAIKAPQMWAIGYTGYGRKVMSQDTGVEEDHPAISSNFEGNFSAMKQSWFELGEPGAIPSNCGGHGTHTVGIMCGLDQTTSDTIGVAFEARWIGTPGLCGGGSSTDRHIAAYQWAMDPDGNISTYLDMPDVINNSWQDPNTSNECNGLYKSTFNALEAAGIALVFSAGNGGSSVSTITKPKNINTNEVNVFCVANVNANVVGFPISNSSSRGPSTCGGSGSLNIKPEVAGPGTNVRSSYNGDYSLLSGTSMAAPHVAGAIALLKQAFPYLTGTEIKYGLYYSCQDLGDPGEDNVYGMGLIDIPAAYNYLIGQGNVPVSLPVNDVAILRVNGIEGYICDSGVIPEIVIENHGTSTLNSLTIVYQYDNLDSSIVIWNGTLISMDTMHLTLPLEYLANGNHQLQVSLTNPNGQPDDMPFNNISNKEFDIKYTINTKPGFICLSGSAELIADIPPSGTIIWFDNSVAGNVIDTGIAYITPVISKDTFFYADVIDTSFVGKFDTAGGGAFFTSSSRYLIFDCFSPFTINSVKVLASTSGNRTIVLKNSLGNVLSSVSVNVTIGMNRVVLNMDILPGNNYSLGITGSVNLYRNNQNVSYPYTVPGVMSIKNSDQGSNYYYYYYDWEISYGSPCGRTEVPVTIMQPISASFTANPQFFNILSDDQVQFIDRSLGAGNWNWSFGDGITSTDKNPIHVYPSFESDYIITLIVFDSANTCSDTSVMSYQLVSGIEGNVFPNPGSGLFTIDLGVSQNEIIELSLFDCSGKRLIEKYTAEIQSTFLIIDISNLADGLYLTKIKTNQNAFVEKLLKITK